jgi:hypothetical protein
MACGHRALSEGDAASAEALWTMPHFCGIAVIVHAGGALLTAEIATLFVQQCMPTAIEKLSPEDFRCYGYRIFCDPMFSFAKENQKIRRRDGDEQWQSITWKPR